MAKSLPESNRVNRLSTADVGIYIHVPFCELVCPYCDFAVTARKNIPHKAYADALIRELDERAFALEGRRVRTIYVGGGTPSRLAPGELSRVLEHARQLAGRQPLDEVTIEANPTDITLENIAVWKRAGVNRVSLGVQSFQERVLRRLGRNHDGEVAEVAIERLLDGDLRASIDLIFGAPEQTEEEWASDLEVFQRFVRERGLSHLSAYNLTIEPATPYSRMASKGEISIPGEDQCARFYEMLFQAASEVGVEPYEVSSWSSRSQQANTRAVHNGLYWSGAEYLGVGVGAHSLEISDDGRVWRSSNTRHLNAYLLQGRAACEREELGARDHLEERIFVALRTRAGLDLGELEHQFGDLYASVQGELMRRLEDLEKREMVTFISPSVCAPTRGALLLADAIGAWATGGL